LPCISNTNPLYLGGGIFSWTRCKTGKAKGQAVIKQKPRWIKKGWGQLTVVPGWVGTLSSLLCFYTDWYWKQEVHQQCHFNSCFPGEPGLAGFTSVSSSTWSVQQPLEISGTDLLWARCPSCSRKGIWPVKACAVQNKWQKNTKKELAKTVVVSGWILTYILTFLWAPCGLRGRK